MIPILFEKNETEFATNGICRLYDCTRCEVTEERNSVYEVEFDYPVDGPQFDKIYPGRIIAVEHDEKGDLQPFDIYGYSKPIAGVVTFKAHHISYRLSEMTVTGTNITTLSGAFALFAAAEPSNPFTFDSDITSNNYLAAADGIPHTVREMLGGIEGSLLDSYRAEFEWDVFNVNVWASRGQEKDFTIRYGVNLVDYNEDLDFSETYTAVIPYWTGDDGNGVEITVIGDMVDSGVTTFGDRTICVPLDMTDKFESQPTTAQLEAAAASYLEAVKPYNPSQNIVIDFVKIQDTSTEKALAGLHHFGLCDSVRVCLPRYNIDDSYKIVRVVWDVLLERYIEMELGNLSSSLAQALGINK